MERKGNVYLKSFSCLGFSSNEFKKIKEPLKSLPLLDISFYEHFNVLQNQEFENLNKEKEN